MELYFNEKEHSYTDDLHNVYTSMTTVIGKYEHKFNTNEMAVAVTKNPNSAYYRMTPKRVKEIWREMNKISLIKGNNKHNYQEEAIKTSTHYLSYTNLYNSSTTKNINTDKIYTVDDIIKNPTIGAVDLKKLKSAMYDRYPKIYKLISIYVERGYYIYAEVGTYIYKYLISGLIDLLLYNPTTKSFVIIDWKTNKHDMIPNGKDKLKWLSGYFKKDRLGNETNRYILTNQFMKFPLNKYQSSHFVIYMLQLSGYAATLVDRGLTCDDIILCHIRDEFYTEEGLTDKERVDFHRMPIVTDTAMEMFKHHFSINAKKQVKMF